MPTLVAFQVIIDSYTVNYSFFPALTVPGIEAMVITYAKKGTVIKPGFIAGTFTGTLYKQINGGSGGPPSQLQASSLNPILMNDFGYLFVALFNTGSSMVIKNISQRGKQQTMLVGLVFLLTSIIHGQTPRANCAPIKNGTFYLYPTATEQAYRIIRKDTLQYETNLLTGTESLWKLHWTSDCSFTLKFLRRSEPLSEQEIAFWSVSLIVVNIQQVKRDYYLFTSGIDSGTGAVLNLPDTCWRKDKHHFL